MPSRRRSGTRRNIKLLTSSPQYPGYYLTSGVRDRAAVRAVQQQLNQIGCGPVAENGIYDSQTQAAVQLFQARSVDGQCQSLKIAGVIEPVTWTALFG